MNFKNKNITRLNLSKKGLKEIPLEVFQLKDLRKLNLSNNKLSNIPKEIEGLTKLETLDISNNKISSFYSKLCCLKNLKILNLNHNNIKHIPKQIIELKKLNSLHLAYNKLTSFPLELFELNSLRQLDVSNNQVKVLPKEIARLKKLKKLWLNKMPLLEFPNKEIANMNSLESLYCFGSIQNLDGFDVNYNELKAVKGNVQKLLVSKKKLAQIEINHFKNIVPILNITKKVFISYSHKDRDWLTLLQNHLKVLELHLNMEIEIWNDTLLSTGENWEFEIKKAISNSQIAILLVSTNFLASDFINRKEIPEILDASDANGTRIMPVIIKPCLFKRSKLSKYQSLNDPNYPLSSLRESEVDEYFVNLSDEIYKILN